MPDRTLFQKYKPCIFGELRVFRGKFGDNDFQYDNFESLDCEKICLEHGDQFEFEFDCTGRDGLYNEDQLFAVWEKKDIENLIERLRWSLNTCND